MARRQYRQKRRFKLLNQLRPVTMIASTTPGTHNPRINAQTVTNRLREIGEKNPYTMYVLYAAFLFWPSIGKQQENTRDTIFFFLYMIFHQNGGSKLDWPPSN